MPAISPTWEQVNPSIILPDAIVQYQQSSGAFDLLSNGGAPMVRLGSEDMVVYIKVLDIRTKTASGQSAFNQLPSVTVTNKMIQTPTYLTRVRAEYDHHDIASMSRWGVSLEEAQRLGMRQGTFQKLRDALLGGFNPVNGEGLLNTQGAVTVSLPPDSNGNTTVVTYDNGQLAQFILNQIQQVKTRTLQMGNDLRFTITGPQRILGQMEYQVVQLTQFQRVGAGSSTTTGMIRSILGDMGDILDWTYDDTLIGKGPGGSDAVIIAMPELKKPKGHKIETNEFANLTNGMTACNIMLLDMAAPMEIPTPLPGGAIDIVSEIRSTSGWGTRPEAVVIVGMIYQ